MLSDNCFSNLAEAGNIKQLVIIGRKQVAFDVFYDLQSNQDHTTMPALPQPGQHLFLSTNKSVFFLPKLQGGLYGPDPAARCRQRD